MNIENHLWAVVAMTLISAFLVNAEENNLVKLKPFPPNTNTEFANRSAKERQKLFAALQSPIDTVLSDALKDIALLADREAVFYLAEMLNNPHNGGRMTYLADDGTIQRSNDVAMMPPRWEAGWKLSELIENPPVPPGGAKRRWSEAENEVKIWQKWWQEHRAEFKEFWDVPELPDEEENKIQETTFETVLPVLDEEPVNTSVNIPFTQINAATNLEPTSPAITDEAAQPEKKSLGKTILWVFIITLLAIVGGVIVWKNKP